jgi:hypothetical protein
MPRFLVELYVCRSQAADDAPARRARAAARELEREGVPVRYVRTTLLPDDETCFHVFEAPSLEAVAEASRRAGLDGARIVRVVERASPCSARRARA